MASLARHFGTRGRKRSLQMCYECEAGRRDAPYEDINRTAAWTQTLYRSRPWDQPPPLLVVPFEPEDGRQEFLYKRDIFHIVKLGLLRHWVASTLVSLIQWGCAFTVEGEPNAVGYQLERAHAFLRCGAWRSRSLQRCGAFPGTFSTGQMRKRPRGPMSKPQIVSCWPAGSALCFRLMLHRRLEKSKSS